jgi:hypothetical protein
VSPRPPGGGLAANSSIAGRVDSTDVTGDTEDRGNGDTQDAQRPRLHAVVGPVVGGAPAPPVRLVREFKGLTVADMTREDLVAKLPGQVKTALRHIETGDLAAAERALPGRFAQVLVGPGHRRRSRRLGWVVITVALAVAVAVLVAAGLGT